MAKRILNRRELRKASDEAEKMPAAEQTEEASPKKKAKAKSPAVPKVKKPRKKKEPPRMCARWGVFDASMRQVAIFPYNQRSEADKKVVELAAKKNGQFFIQIVKEAMPDAVPVEAVLA